MTTSYWVLGWHKYRVPHCMWLHTAVQVHHPIADLNPYRFHASSLPVIRCIYYSKLGQLVPSQSISCWVSWAWTAMPHYLASPLLTACLCSPILTSLSHLYRFLQGIGYTTSRFLFSGVHIMQNTSFFFPFLLFRFFPFYFSFSFPSFSFYFLFPFSFSFFSLLLFVLLSFFFLFFFFVWMIISATLPHI